jgi:hypothetical protein
VKIPPAEGSTVECRRLAINGPGHVTRGGSDALLSRRD